MRPKVGVGAATPTSTATVAGAPCALAALAAGSTPQLEPKPLEPKPLEPKTLEPQTLAAGGRLGPARLVARGGMLGSSAEAAQTLALTLALALTLTLTLTPTLTRRAPRRAAWAISRGARSWSARCRSSRSGRSTCAR